MAGGAELESSKRLSDLSWQDTARSRSQRPRDRKHPEINSNQRATERSLEAVGVDVGAERREIGKKRDSSLRGPTLSHESKGKGKIGALCSE